MLKVQRKQEAAVPQPKFRPTMDQIHALERELAAHPGRLMELRTEHHFAPGMYAREMHIPAGVMLTGRTHRTGHLCSISAGTITVWSEGGEGLQLKAPCTFESLPGAKRVGFAHTDVVFTTYHPNPTNERDLAKLEQMMLDDTSDQVIEDLCVPKIEGGPL